LLDLLLTADIDEKIIPVGTRGGIRLKQLNPAIFCLGSGRQIWTVSLMAIRLPRYGMDLFGQNNHTTTSSAQWGEETHPARMNYHGQPA
jgi:hypothetical protein